MLSSKNPIVLLALFGLIVAFASCKKESNDNSNATSWSSSIPAAAPVNELAKQLALTPEVKTMPASIFTSQFGETVSFKDGLIIRFYNDRGNPITRKDGRPFTSSPVVFKEVLMDKMGKMVRMNRPTISEQKLLRTGGAFYLEVTQDSVPILMNYTFSLPQKRSNERFNLFTDDTANASTNIWMAPDTNTSIIDPRSNYSWVDSSRQSTSPDTSFNNYCCVNSRFHWINCDYFYNWPDASLTPVKVALPGQFNNQNTTSFVLFTTINSVINLFGNPSALVFETSSGYEAPIGMQVTILTVSKIGSRYYLGRLSTTLPNQGTINVLPVETPLNDINFILSHI